MNCPFCGNADTQVKDSRASDNSIRRRRFCTKCSGRFTTFERVQLNPIVVIKRSGKKRPFEREKLLRSIQVAARKRPISESDIDNIVNRIAYKVESSGEHEIQSTVIGRLAMAELKDIDGVAYIRFSSVYEQFDDINNFVTIINSMN